MEISVSEALCVAQAAQGFSAAALLVWAGTRHVGAGDVSEPVCRRASEGCSSSLTG